MTPSQVLSTTGIAAVPDIWAPAEVVALNSALDEVFRTRSDEARSYVAADELLDLGLLDHVLPTALVTLFGHLIADPVLYHCHAYEIRGSDSRPHIHGSLLAGWHRDSETLAAFDPDDARFLSVFLYLSDVGPTTVPSSCSPATRGTASRVGFRASR